MLVQDYIIIVIILSLIASIVAFTVAGVLSLSKIAWAQLFYLDYSTVFVAVPQYATGGIWFVNERCPAPAYVFDPERINRVYPRLLATPLGNVVQFSPAELSTMLPRRSIFCYLTFHD